MEGDMYEHPNGPEPIAYAGMKDSTKAPVYLTFDDGPDPAWTPRVLAELRAAGATATFFVIAPLARSFPALIREIVARRARRWLALRQARASH